MSKQTNDSKIPFTTMEWIDSEMAKHGFKRVDLIPIPDTNDLVRIKSCPMLKAIYEDKNERQIEYFFEEDDQYTFRNLNFSLLVRNALAMGTLSKAEMADNIARLKAGTKLPPFDLNTLPPMNDQAINERFYRLVGCLLKVGKPATPAAKPDDDQSNFLKPMHKEAAYLFGEALYELGEAIRKHNPKITGRVLMVAAHDCVTHVLGTVPAKELEFAWNGIGGWQA